MTGATYYPESDHLSADALSALGEEVREAAFLAGEKEYKRGNGGALNGFDRTQYDGIPRSFVEFTASDPKGAQPMVDSLWQTAHVLNRQVLTVVLDNKLGDPVPVSTSPDTATVGDRVGQQQLTLGAHNNLKATAKATINVLDALGAASLVSASAGLIETTAPLFTIHGKTVKSIVGSMQHAMYRIRDGIAGQEQEVRRYLDKAEQQLQPALVPAPRPTDLTALPGLPVSTLTASTPTNPHSFHD